MTLIALSAAWLIGIAAAHWLHPPLALIGMVAVLPLVAFFLWWDDPKARRVAACGLFLLLGLLRYTLSLPNLSDPGHIAAYRDRGQAILWGRVVGEPDVRDTYTNLRLAVDRVRIEREDHSHSSESGPNCRRGRDKPAPTHSVRGRIGRCGKVSEYPELVQGRGPVEVTPFDRLRVL
jgi:hypothetical protein